MFKVVPLSPSKGGQAKVVELPEKVDASQHLDDLQPLPTPPPHCVDLTNLDAVETFSALKRMMNSWIVEDNVGKLIQTPLITEVQLLAAAPAAIEEAIVGLYAIVKQGAVSQEVQNQIFTAILRDDPIVTVQGPHGNEFNVLTDDSTKGSRTRLAGLLTPRIFWLMSQLDKIDMERLTFSISRLTVSQLFTYFGLNIHNRICDEKKMLADEAEKDNAPDKEERKKFAKLWTGSKTVGRMRLHADWRDRSTKDDRFTTGKIFRHLSIGNDDDSVGGSSVLSEEETVEVAEVVKDAFSYFYADEDDTTVPELVDATNATSSSSGSSAIESSATLGASESPPSGIAHVDTEATSSSNAAGNAEDETVDSEDPSEVAMSEAYDDLTGGPIEVEEGSSIAGLANRMSYVPTVSGSIKTRYPNGKLITRMDPTSSRLYLGDRTHAVSNIDTPEGHSLIALNAILGVKPVTLHILGFKVRFIISHCPGSPHPDYIRMVSQSKVFFGFNAVAADGGADNDMYDKTT